MTTSAAAPPPMLRPQDFYLTLLGWEEERDYRMAQWVVRASFEGGVRATFRFTLEDGPDGRLIQQSWLFPDGLF